MSEKNEEDNDSTRPWRYGFTINQDDGIKRFWKIRSGKSYFSVEQKQVSLTEYLENDC